jgi:hypothetical protein
MDNQEDKNVKKNQAKRKKVRFIKTGGGSFRMGPEYKNRIIKPGQIFEAYPEDIPKAFRDVVKPVTPLPEPEEEKIPDSTTFVIKPKGKSKTWFDVIDTSSEKPINEKALRKEEAEQLLSELI